MTTLLKVVSARRSEFKALSLGFLSMSQMIFLNSYSDISLRHCPCHAVATRPGSPVCSPTGSSTLRINGRPAELSEDHQHGTTTTWCKMFKRCDCVNFGPRVLAALYKSANNKKAWGSGINRVVINGGEELMTRAIGWIWDVSAVGGSWSGFGKVPIEINLLSLETSTNFLFVMFYATCHVCCLLIYIVLIFLQFCSNFWHKLN